MTELFNFVWANPPPTCEETLAVALFERQKIVCVLPVAALILYPSLMTPLVYRKDEQHPWLELLLASSESRLLPVQVNQQLKLYPGLGAEKRVDPLPLFTGTYDNIVVEPAELEAGSVLRTHQGFTGVLHRLVKERLEKHGLTHFYKLRVRHQALERARSASYKLPPKQSSKESPRKHVELSDEIMGEVLTDRHDVTGFAELKHQGQFAFRATASGPQLWDELVAAKGEEPAHVRSATDEAEPIQSYHPVYLLEDDGPKYLNFGHLTDIHINSRLDILQQNPVRVLPYSDGKVAEQHGSRQVSELIQPTNRSFASLLRAMASDRQAHALLVGGDLVDHLLNAKVERAPKSMQEVWAAVSLDENEKPQRYAHCVDMVAFYGLLLEFCRSSKKPVFGVNGNHDAYLQPFGISPRAFGVRANEGIPADVNLTFYEAALAFGPTWAECEMPAAHLVTGEPMSSFLKEWMEWYYGVFTPFSDCSVQLPAQQLVCLGWGEDEDMFFGGQGSPGHLPRADQSVSPVQLKLLREATAKASERQVVALTHFTIASFRETIPLFDSREHRPSVGWIGGYESENEYNMGTFESRRDEVLELLAERSIACVFSGHSHRRGLYFIGELARREIERTSLQKATAPWSSGSERVTLRTMPVTIHDPDGYQIPSDQPPPALLTSDCGGPYPRHNRYGEFKGWGSDKPGGSVALFDGQGRLREVKVVRADVAEPRLAVAVDYLDLVGDGERGAISIETELFRSEDEDEFLLGGSASCSSTGGAPGYVLVVHVHPNLVQAKVGVTKLVLHAPGRLEALAIETLRLPSSEIRIPLGPTMSRAFHTWAWRATEPDRFVSVHFDWSANASVSTGYKWDEPWHFEAICTKEWRRPLFRYAIRRPLRTTTGERDRHQLYWPEVPDFSWRRMRPPTNAGERRPVT